jgi:hypothetical protein
MWEPDPGGGGGAKPERDHGLKATQQHGCPSLEEVEPEHGPMAAREPSPREVDPKGLPWT